MYGLTKTRLTGYIVAALTGLATILTLLGWATFDRATGTVDISPFNVFAVAGLVAGPVASLVAALALWFGWGRGTRPPKWLG